jgi:hypothetical protein
VTTPLQAAGTLVALAEEGSALAASGRLDDLAAQQPAWDAAVRALGPLGALAPETAALVARAAQLQGEQAAILAAAQAEVGSELARLRATRRGARGYAGAGLPAQASSLSATA